MLVYVVLVPSTDAMWTGFDILAAGVAEREGKGDVWRAVAALVGFGRLLRAAACYCIRYPVVSVRRLSAIADLFGPLRLGCSCIACGGLPNAELLDGVCSGTHFEATACTLVRLTRIMCHHNTSNLLTCMQFAQAADMAVRCDGFTRAGALSFVHSVRDLTVKCMLFNSWHGASLRLRSLH